MTRLATLCSVASALLLGGTASAADVFGHFDQIAARLERQAYQLTTEVAHYRHTPQYPHLVRDAQLLARTARHAHVTAHVGCDLAHLEADVRELDSVIHHVHELVDAIEHDAAFGRGHVHGRTSHVHSLLASMESNVHHLMNDLRLLRRTYTGHGHRGHDDHNHGIYSPSVIPSPYGNSINRRIPPGWGNAMPSNPLHSQGRVTINRRIPAGWGSSMSRRPSIQFHWGF